MSERIPDDWTLGQCVYAMSTGKRCQKQAKVVVRYGSELANPADRTTGALVVLDESAVSLVRALIRQAELGHRSAHMRMRLAELDSRLDGSTELRAAIGRVVADRHYLMADHVMGVVTRRINETDGDARPESIDRWTDTATKTLLATVSATDADLSVLAAAAESPS